MLEIHHCLKAPFISWNISETKVYENSRRSYRFHANFDDIETEGKLNFLVKSRRALEDYFGKAQGLTRRTYNTFTETLEQRSFVPGKSVTSNKVQAFTVILLISRECNCHAVSRKRLQIFIFLFHGETLRKGTVQYENS